MWREHAKCKNVSTQAHSWFWGEDDSLTAHEQHARARKVCFSCPVQIECLQDAVKNDEAWAVWGGFTASQRRRYIVPKVKKNPLRKQVAEVILKVGAKFMRRLEEQGLPSNRKLLESAAKGPAKAKSPYGAVDPNYDKDIQWGFGD